MNDHDILDVLKFGDPAPLDTVPGPDSQLARQILATVMANAAAPVPPTRRPRRLLAAVIAAAVIAATAVTAWALNNRTATNPVSVLCYDAASTSASAIEAPRAAVPDSSACAPFWDNGVLPISSDLPRGQVPPLVACVNDGGTLAVFPGDEPGLCADLGLADAAPPSAGPSVVPDAAFQLRQQLIDTINAQTCLSIDDAEQATLDTFRKLGINDWTVQPQPVNPARPCASLAIDEANHTIILVPTPRLDGP